MFESSTMAFRLLPLLGVGILGACSSPGGIPPDASQTASETIQTTPSPSEGASPTAAPTASASPTPTPTGLQNTPTAGITPSPTATFSPIPTGSFEATIRYTEGGVPHILADTLENGGFGHGFAFAQGNVCILAEQVMKAKSTRSRYLGPGDAGQHLDWDFAMLHLGVYAHAQAAWPQFSDQTHALVRGFVAGYNHYLSKTDPADLPAPCTHAPWVKPISAIDLTAYYVTMALMGSSQPLVPGISRAFPPGDDAQEPLPLPKMADLKLDSIGSNGWAIGGDDSDTGKGIVLANPHFPWEGELRFSEVHLRIPGVMDAYGGALMGSIVPNIGFNPAVAWTHTFSWASRMSFYELTLDPRNPTRYRYDGRYRDMEATHFSIQVLGEDGQLTVEDRTLWNTHWGPILSTEEFGWSAISAITFRDINEGNTFLMEHFVDMALAEDMAAFKAVHENTRAIPWAYTIAASAEGEAYFVDSSLVPNLSESAIVEWQAALEGGDPLTQLAWTLGVPLLDGTTSTNEWVKTNGVTHPYAIPFEAAPQLSRQDYVFNSNDSHWLANPEAPLLGYSPLFGAEGTPRRPRTRMNLRYLTEDAPASFRGSDNRFSVAELADLFHSNRGMMEELLHDDVARRCFSQTMVLLGANMVDITPTCEAIEAWSGRSDVTSKGAAAWREFTGYFGENGLMDAGDVFSVPFDAADPIDTPRDLAAAPAQGQDPILQALATAQKNLDLAGFAPDVALGEIQYTLKGDERISIPGGQEQEGVFNTAYYSGSFVTHTSILPRMEPGEPINNSTHLTDAGYLVNYGSSYVMLMGFTDDGPQGRVTLTYSQSADPTSPHFADQTRAYQTESWRPIRFTEEEILSDPALRVEVVRSDD